MRIRSTSVKTWSLALSAFVIAACNGGSSDPGPAAQAAIALFEGDAQTGAAGSAVAVKPAVRTTTNGSPTSGVSVTFAVASGGGTITGATQTTDANGVARVGSWTLGTGVGANTLTATAANATGSPITFTATATAGAVAQLAKSGGDAQSATVGASVATAPAVEVRDQFGNKIAGQQVTFAVTGGGGSITGATQTSDANGIARVGSWTLGATAGANTLSATVGTVSTTFTAMGTAGAATQAFKQAGDAQTIAAGTAVTVRPAVRVADQFGNPVAGVTVTFATTTGTLTGATQTTGADGIATVGSWTLKPTVGANTLTATVTGTGITGSPLSFTATGVAGAPAVLTKIGDNQTAIAGTALANPIAVDVTDQFGNIISGQPVTFAVAVGGGSVTGAGPLTNALGRATLGSWTLGPLAGANSLTATAGTASVTFNATASAAFNAAQYVGTYAGNWVNTTFGSTGTGNVVVSIDPVTKVATAQITVTGPVLGTPGVAPSTQNTTYGPAGATFNGVHAVMGTVTASIDATGHIVAAGTNVPNAGITRWDATGTVTASQLLLNFTVTFTSGPPAVGTITLNKL